MTSAQDALHGQVALVTGASRGIGAEIARALHAAGAEVILAARSLDTVTAAAGAIAPDGERVRAVAIDVTDSEAVDRSVALLLEACGRIPLLVNNAGITRDALLLRMKADDWNAVLATNLTAIYQLTRALLPSMVRARFGRIVNITSVVAATGNPGQANYAAAKAGVEGFTRSLAREVASRNVTVNCVAPGFIDTDMTRELPEAARQRLLEQVPLGRLGRPEDVAAAVLYLVGSGGAYVTGSTLPVNGGMYM
jgi:3-oxoacyl-[acyl-carrier protein] reductase